MPFLERSAKGIGQIAKSPFAVGSKLFAKIMAWWTHIIFLGKHEKNRQQELLKEEFSLAHLGRVLRQYIFDNFIEILYMSLSAVTYVYLALTVITFFFANRVPHVFPKIIETLSEPYLGILGIYVVVKEMERRRGHVKTRTWGELFAVAWIMFLIVATFMTFYTTYYPANELYKTVVTNALAALIIRLGTIIR